MAEVRDRSREFTLELRRDRFGEAGVAMATGPECARHFDNGLGTKRASGDLEFVPPGGIGWATRSLFAKSKLRGLGHG